MIFNFEEESENKKLMTDWDDYRAASLWRCEATLRRYWRICDRINTVRCGEIWMQWYRFVYFTTGQCLAVESPSLDLKVDLGVCVGVLFQRQNSRRSVPFFGGGLLRFYAAHMWLLHAALAAKYFGRPSAGLLATYLLVNSTEMLSSVFSVLCAVQLTLLVAAGTINHLRGSSRGRVIPFEYPLFKQVSWSQKKIIRNSMGDFSLINAVR